MFRFMYFDFVNALHAKMRSNETHVTVFEL